MPKKITPQKQLDEINQVILADNKIHPAEDKLLKIFTEMFCSNEVVNNLKEQSHNPEARDIMYRFIHLDNILSVALIDGEFHELEVKEMYANSCIHGIHGVGNGIVDEKN